jgi:hypothetical protein
MERNIIASLESGELIPGISHDSPHIIATPSRDEQDAKCCDDVYKPARIRTISAMDQVMIEALKEPTTKVSSVVPASRPLRDAHGRPPLPSGRARLPVIQSQGSSISLELSPEESRYTNHQMLQSSNEESTETLRGEALLDSLLDDGPLEQDVKLEAAPYASKPIQNHVRRNTGGTIFVKSTMMNPNIEATIKVSAVLGFLPKSLGNRLTLSLSLFHSVRVWCLSNSYYQLCSPTFQSITDFNHGARGVSR